MIRLTLIILRHCIKLHPAFVSLSWVRTPRVTGAALRLPGTMHLTLSTHHHCNLGLHQHDHTTTASPSTWTRSSYAMLTDQTSDLRRLQSYVHRFSFIALKSPSKSIFKSFAPKAMLISKKSCCWHNLEYCVDDDRDWSDVSVDHYKGHLSSSSVSSSEFTNTSSPVWMTHTTLIIISHTQRTEQASACVACKEY